jgi:hypothetical protein
MGGLVLLAYEGTPTKSTVEALASFGATHIRAAGARVGVLVVIRTGDRVPDAATRAALAGLMKRFEPNIAALAQVVVGSGFGAAAVRAVLAGMNLVARAAYPTEVFAEIQPALQWISGQGVGAPTEVRLAVARLVDGVTAT